MKNRIDKYGLSEFTEKKFPSAEQEYFQLMLFCQWNTAYLLRRHITDIQIIVALILYNPCSSTGVHQLHLF